MSVKEFADLWLRELPHDSDEENLVSMLAYAHGRRELVPSILMYYPHGADFEKWRQQVDQTLWTGLERSKPGSDRQKEFVDGFIALSSQPESLKKMAAMLDGALKLPGLEIDQKRRWHMLQHLAVQNFEGVLARIDAESKHDPSAIGADEALSARVSVPSESVKKDSLVKVGEEKGEWNFAQRKVVMGALFPVEQMTLRNQFSNNFFANLERFVGPDSKSDFFLESYMSLAPLEPGPMKIAQDFLVKHTVLPETVSRALKELIENGERLQRVLTKSKP